MHKYRKKQHGLGNMYKLGSTGVVVLVLVAVRCSDAFFFDDDCGGEPYDKETEICCDDVKYEKGPHDKCCGGTIIDTRVSACSLGFVFHNRRKGCDNVYYKREELVCCSKKLYPNNGYLECCSGELMDNRASVCVWGFVANTRKGCDGKYFDEDTEFCCAGLVHPKDSTHTCCGGKTVYDPTKFTCEVAGYVLPK
ncbi:hypothetical protein NP493_249g12027 [Ridgeia piscesae]|uniref:Galaxin-like repeats domain-containing protein n=1 Tax=Ridgeia piscesae TaxID=27915 RepID=A0AAD9NYU0_RIDPI|nr:hypothetical protein NP493_249g12027 [Ridgeia piscesae]